MVHLVVVLACHYVVVVLPVLNQSEVLLDGSRLLKGLSNLLN